MAGSRQGDGMRRHVGDLPAFGLLLLPRPVPGSLLSESYQSQMQMASVKQSDFLMDEKFIILVLGRECLYNLQHNYCDDNLVKYSSWKEIAGELHAQDKELSRRTQHCRRMAGSWHGNGMVRMNRPSATWNTVTRFVWLYRLLVSAGGTCWPRITEGQ
jgi:hypothetical protein